MACIKVTAYAKYMHDPLMIIIEQRPWLVLPTLNLAYERRGDIEKLNIVWSAFFEDKGQGARAYRSEKPSNSYF